MFKNTQDTYGTFTIFLHWLTVILVVAIFIIGYIMDSANTVMWHKSLGLTVFVITIVRIAWIHVNPGPSYPTHMNRLEKNIATFVRYFIYVCLIFMPLTGWIFSTAAGYPPNLFGLGTIAFPITQSQEVASIVHDIHVALSTLFLIVLILHALAALKHHYIDKDNLLKRMCPHKKS